MQRSARRNGQQLVTGAIAGLRSILVWGALLSLLPGQAAAESMLDSLPGSWRGSGTAIVHDMQREMITCRASYERTGDSLSQLLKCGNPRYVFDLAGTITRDGDALVGEWQERRREIGGKVSGYVDGRSVVLSLDGPDFDAQVTLVVNGCAQSMRLQTSSDRLRAIDVEFRKREC